MDYTLSDQAICQLSMPLSTPANQIEGDATHDGRKPGN
jgi:hypothetical protein